MHVLRAFLFFVVFFFYVISVVFMVGVDDATWMTLLEDGCVGRTMHTIYSCRSLRGWVRYSIPILKKKEGEAGVE